jgi:pilus assembly protein CpaB
VLRRTKPISLPPDDESAEGTQPAETETSSIRLNRRAQDALRRPERKPVLPQHEMDFPPADESAPPYPESDAGAEPDMQRGARSERANMGDLRQQYHWVLVNKSGEPESDMPRRSFAVNWRAPQFRVGLVVLALAAGGLAAFLAVQRAEPPALPAPTAVEVPVVPEVMATKVLVATAAIGTGQRLTSTSVEWADWPESGIRPGYITNTATPEAITDMDGTMARFEIFPGEPIQQDKLVSPGQGYLSAVLASGMRGISVTVNADAASGGFVVPNDHVDVVLTRTLPNGEMNSDTVLRNVRVIAIDTRLGETGTTGATEDPADPKAAIFATQAIATLEVDETGAEVITSAVGLGRLSLALRAMTDFGAAASTGREAANQAIRLTSPFWTK